MGVVTTDNNHKVDKQKLETPKTAEVPAQIPAKIKEEIKNSKIVKTRVQLSEKTQSTTQIKLQHRKVTIMLTIGKGVSIVKPMNIL